MEDKIIWTRADMISAFIEHNELDDDAASECRVIETTDDDDNPCFAVAQVRGITIVRSSEESGDSGLWHLDYTAYGD